MRQMYSFSATFKEGVLMENAAHVETNTERDSEEILSRIQAILLSNPWREAIERHQRIFPPKHESLLDDHQGHAQVWVGHRNMIHVKGLRSGTYSQEDVGGLLSDLKISFNAEQLEMLESNMNDFLE